MGKIYKYTNAFIEKIQKNKRKIIAIVNQSQIHRIKVYILLVAMMISMLDSVFAIDNPNIEYGDYRIFCHKDTNMYVMYGKNPQPNYEYYYIKDGNEYPVYCINLGLKGAEERADGYVVNANKNIDDNILHNIVLNCYPYKSVEELGVKTVSQAKFASQFAIWIYTSNLNENYISAILPEYECVVNAIKNIYDSATIKKSSQNNDNDNIVFNEQKIEKSNGIDYYTKEVEIINQEKILNLELYSEDKNIIIEKNNGKYKIKIPVDKVDSEYESLIKINIEAKEENALFGISTEAGYQDVAITLKNTFDLEDEKEVEFKNLKRNISIIKKDATTDELLEGVKYYIKYENGDIIGEYTTDKNGRIDLKIYENQNILIEEIEALKDYILDNNVYELKEDETEKVLYNKKKEGNIKIIKKSKEYNELSNLPENTPLKDVRFYIYNQDMELVDDIVTNEYGIAISKNLPVGKYYIKEYETNLNYQLLENMVEVEIMENEEIVNVEILNDNVEIPKKLPITGR